MGSEAAQKLIGGNNHELVENILSDDGSSFQPLPKYKEPTGAEEEDGFGQSDQEAAGPSDDSPVIEAKIDTAGAAQEGSDAIIQKGDCFYDAQGNFLHRVPGLVKSNRRTYLQ